MHTQTAVRHVAVASVCAALVVATSVAAVAATTRVDLARGDSIDV